MTPHPLMTPTNKQTWNAAVETLMSMCVADQTGNGPTPEAFIMTLRTYANCMEELLPPKAETDPP